MGSKVQIKHRFTGVVLFECDVPEEHSGMAMRHALESATKSGANLYGAKIDGEEIGITPISIGGLEWRVLITDGYMRIGCQRHTHSEWVEFSESQIAEMSDSACEFWSQWKAPLLSMCAAHASMVKPREAEAA